MSRYVSTRGGEQEPGAVSYEHVVMNGLAPDGGLYVPTELPRFTEEQLRNFSGLSYPELFVAVRSHLVGDSISKEEQLRLAEAAYDKASFPLAENGVITPVRQLGPDLYIQELSLGPTAAFKDLGLRALGQDMQYFLKKKGESLRLLGATSGDTGSAAEAAVKGLNNVMIFMLSPRSGMTDFQRAQMARLSDVNVHNIAINGRFDECQALVKEIKADPEFADLGAVNSINWGRIASQIPYYFAGYFQVVGDEIGKEVDFTIPTGNFGNMLAAYYAKQMGLPIRRIIAATNENSVVDTLIQTGIYQKPGEAIVTSSPSMDITVASNYERLIYDILGKDPEETKKYMEKFEATGRVTFSDFAIAWGALRNIKFNSGVSTHEDRLAAIKYAAQQDDLIDPHTADAVTVALKLRGWSRTREIGRDLVTPMICLSTALPVKFAQTIREALGYVPPTDDERFADMVKNSPRYAFTTLNPDPEAVKNLIREKTLEKGQKSSLVA